jgi:geranylgeranyl reductase family protein
MNDVAVVGTGPAGCVAAMTLARAGASVVMIDKAQLPRYKTCGGGLLYRATQLLPASFEQTITRQCYAAELNFASANAGDSLHFVTRRAQPLVSMTMRADLDHVLALEAQDAGATLMTRCAVRGITQTAHRVTLQTTQGDIHARFVIAADGANSFIATAAGWRETRKLIPALEYEITVNDHDFARLSETARFDFGVIEAGYAWTFPKRAHLSVGVLSMHRGAVHLQQALQDYLKLLGIPTPLTVEKHGYVIPVTPRTDALARGRILLTGDAAGLVDPVTAEGITHAIRSGQIAAQTLVDCAFNAASAAGDYQSRIQNALLGELKAARLLARLLYDYPRLRNWAFRKHGQALSELVADVVLGQRTLRDAACTLGNYLKLLGLRSLRPEKLRN